MNGQSIYILLEENMAKEAKRHQSCLVKIGDYQRRSIIPDSQKLLGNTRQKSKIRRK